MKTNLEVLNEISQKLGGVSNATSVTESLNNIANALGDTNPDQIISVSDSLEDILGVAGGGGGGSFVNPIVTVEVTCSLAKGGEISLAYELDDNELLYSTTFLDNNQTETFECLAVCYESGYYVGVGSDWSIGTSNRVNCTYSNGKIYVTDHTKPASISVEISDGGAN